MIHFYPYIRQREREGRKKKTEGENGVFDDVTASTTHVGDWLQPDCSSAVYPIHDSRYRSALSRGLRSTHGAAARFTPSIIYEGERAAPRLILQNLLKFSVINAKSTDFYRIVMLASKASDETLHRGAFDIDNLAREVRVYRLAIIESIILAIRK